MKTDKKNFIKEILRYLVAGGSAFVCDFAVKTLFYAYILPAEMGYFRIFGNTVEYTVMIATTAGFVVGLIVNYLVSIFYVFNTENQKKRGKGIAPFLIYLVVSVVGLLVNMGVTQLGCNLFSVEQEDKIMFMLISCVAAGVALVWNYIGRKVFVYRGE